MGDNNESFSLKNDSYINGVLLFDLQYEMVAVKY